MIEHVDPFIGTVGDRPAGAARAGGDLVVAQAPGRQHPPRRDLPVRHGVGLRVLRRLPDRLRPATSSTPRACRRELYDRQIASGFTHFQQSGTGAIRKYYNYFRVTPMLEPLDDLGDHLGAAGRGGRARLLRLHAELGHPLRAHRRSAQRRPPLHLPGPPGRPARDRLLDGRPGHPVRLHRSAAVPPGDRSARGWPRPRRSSRALRWPCTWSATPVTGASCCGTTGG